MPNFRPFQALNDGIRAIHADRLWPLKIGVGGLWMLSVLGWLFPQGFLIEHLDNSRRGFRTPLPAWRQYGDKLIMGLFAVIFDFAYFIMPMLLVGVLLFCGALWLFLNVPSAWIMPILLIVLGGFWSLMFGLSLSPLAKLGFAESGDVQGHFGWAAVQRSLSPLARSIYLRARLVTLPLYLPTVGCSVLLWQLIGEQETHSLFILGSIWLLGCTLFWAWLVVGQVYQTARGVVEDREIDARLAARQDG